jgi:adenine-specific DNA-methyltransferase
LVDHYYLTEKEVANGIHPHYDFINKSISEKHNGMFNIGQGIFGLSEQEKNALMLTDKELELIKPYYTTEQLGRYYSNPRNPLWIIYTDSRFKNPNYIKPYPNIKKHLDQFKGVITSDNKPYGLHRARDDYFFKGEKIIALRKCSEQPIFTYTDFDCYVSATFYVIKSKRINQKYLTALLNSILIAFWLKHKGKMQGNNYQIDKEPILAIPICKPSDEDQQPIITLVDRILAITSRPDYVSQGVATPCSKEVKALD